MCSDVILLEVDSSVWLCSDGRVQRSCFVVFRGRELVGEKMSRFEGEVGSRYGNKR